MLSTILVAFVLATRIFITHICHVFASGSQIISHGICLVIYSHFPLSSSALALTAIHAAPSAYLCADDN